MPQKKNAARRSAGPVDLLGSQIEGVDAHAGPFDFSERDIRALATGKRVNFEKFDPVSVSAELDANAPPWDLTEKDIRDLAAGKKLELVQFDLVSVSVEPDGNAPPANLTEKDIKALAKGKQIGRNKPGTKRRKGKA